jgi:voltage-gated potassium channel
MRRGNLSKGEVTWHVIIALAILFTAAEAPWTFTFNTRIQMWQVIVDIIFACLFIADLSYSVRRYRHQKKLPLSQQMPKSKFILQTVVDILACIPFDVLFYFFGLGGASRAMKLLRMLRLVRIVKLWGLISSMPIIPRALKVFLVSTGSLILIHWFTSIWILIHPLEAGMDRVSYYIECFYWAVTTLTTVGYGDITPKTNAGRIYTMFVMFIGVGVYGFVIGNISRIFAESARYKEQTREKYAELNTFMKYYHIPNRLQGAVFNYYNHLFTKRLSDNDAKIISELPQALKAELQVYMNMKLIRNLPVFKYCSQACLKEVASALEQKFYSPSDTIIRIGELGDEMFVIGHGVVDVILEDGSVVAQLHEGQFFGEAALLKETTRNANVRAATYTDLYRLSKDNFLAIIENHPDLLENLQNVSTRRASDRNRATSANT